MHATYNIFHENTKRDNGKNPELRERGACDVHETLQAVRFQLPDGQEMP